MTNGTVTLKTTKVDFRHYIRDAQNNALGVAETLRRAPISQASSRGFEVEGASNYPQDSEFFPHYYK